MNIRKFKLIGISSAIFFLVLIVVLIYLRIEYIDRNETNSNETETIINDSRTYNQAWRIPRGSEYAEIGKLIIQNNIRICGEYHVKEITSEKVKLSEKYSYLELLGYINSDVSNYYFSKLYNIDLHFYPGTFQKMIIPKIPSKELTIIVNYITLAQSNIFEDITTSYFIALSNSLIFEFYFPEELKAANKEILKHLGDLKPITADMSPEEKLAIIQGEFHRLYDPTHPVRNNLETLDNIEEVRIIKEALK